MREKTMSQPVLYSPKGETVPREELEQLQIERLQSTLNRVYRNVAFYRTAFDAHRVNLEKIREVRSLRELPFTTNEDLRKAYPYDLFAVPLRDIVRIHSTAAAAGRPVVVGYTRNDLRTWTECTARLLAAAGITEHDVVQIALDYSLFSGGFGFHQGAEQIGASVIPASLTASVEKQIVIMRDFKTTALISTPGHAAAMAAAMAEMHVHQEALHLALGVFGGERWNESQRQELEGRLHLRATDTYGLAEVLGPGVAGECHLRNGLHINEDHFIAEVIDPKTLQPVAAGEAGELVLTTITREGFPLIRYRTGDLTRIDLTPCACGRTLARMARVAGRTDDRIQFHGVGFFPSQIEEILAEVEGTSPHFQILLDKEAGEDTLEVRVEVSDQAPFLDELRALGSLKVLIAKRIKMSLDIDAKVTLAEPKSLSERGSGAGRVTDRRPG
jgi:phenylacetate-CoA ligase